MAKSFDFKSIYEQEIWTVVHDNAEGYQEKFLNIVKEEIEKSNFPNLEVYVDDYTTGGIFFNKETTQMLCMKAKKSQFKNFEIFFRAQAFGNLVVYSRMECMDRGFFDIITGKRGGELWAQVRNKCKNYAQYEEFLAIDNLADMVFDNALIKMDPVYKERKMLMNK